MHHVVLERWSRRDSAVHAADPRIKLAATLTFLVAVATSTAVPPAAALGYAALLAAGMAASRLPWTGLLARAAIVLPFSGAFAVVSVIAGEPERALALAVKSYLSAVAVLLLVATTPLPSLLHAAERLGAPRMLVLVAQFLYRYLFVISEQSQHMRQAARCRGDLTPLDRVRRRSRFRAAAGALAVLFGRSYQRAEAIHRAMLARGFKGQFRPLASRTSPRAADVALFGAALVLILAVRLGLAGAR